MRNSVRILLSIVALIAGVLSLLSLFWWLLIAYGILAYGGAFGLPQGSTLPGPQAHALAYLSAVNYFLVFGGAFGWVSLFALCAFHRRHLRQLPKWVLIGCTVGALAVVALPVTHMLAYFPLIVACSVLLRCWLVAPNNVVKRTLAS